MLTRITLADLGPHRALDLTLGAPAPAAVAVLGPNGAGKSTVLAAVAYGLSGDPSWVAGGSALAAGDQAKPAVTLGLRPDPAGGDAVLYRTAPGPGWKRAVRKLEYADKKWTAEADVAARLEDWLGLPPRDWGRAAVVRQGRLLDAVDAQPAVRKAALARVLGLDHAARVYDALGDEEKLLAADLDTDQALADAGARAAAALAEAERLAAALAQAPPVDPAALAAARDRLRDAERAAQVSARRAELTHRAAEAARLRDAARDRAAESRRRAGTDNPGDLFVRAGELDHRAAAQAAREAAAAELHTAEAERVRLAATADPGAEPVEPADLAAARPLVGLWRAVAALTAGAPCPTCARPVEGELADQVAAAKAGLAAYDTLTRAHDDRVRDYRQARSAYDRAARRLAALDARRADLAARAAGGEAVAAGVLREQAAALRHRARELEQLHRQAVDADRAGDGLELARSNAAAELAALPDSREPDPEAARTALRALEAADAAHRTAAAEADAAARRAAADAAALTKARQAAAGSAARLEHRGRLGRLRQAFHAGAAPAALMAAFAADRVDAVNAWLAKLAARFRVEAGPDVDFVARFHDGSPPVPADRLSGGEKAVLAWAWAAATAATRLLCLDEPTYGLDQHRLDALCLAVDGWRSAAPECQLVLVTHDRRLADRCDVVLDLGGR